MITTSPSTVASHVNRCAATVPASITPTGVSSGLVATAISCDARLSRSSAKPELGRDHVDRLHEAVAEHLEHRARLRRLRVLAEEHDLAHDHLGRVVADVGELLGAYVADVAAQRRQREREPFGDPAGIDAGAVQRHAGLPARRFERLHSRRVVVG